MFAQHQRGPKWSFWVFGHFCGSICLVRVWLHSLEFYHALTLHLATRFVMICDDYLAFLLPVVALNKWIYTWTNSRQHHHKVLLVIIAGLLHRCCTVLGQCEHASTFLIPAHSIFLMTLTCSHHTTHRNTSMDPQSMVSFAGHGIAGTSLFSGSRHQTPSPKKGDASPSFKTPPVFHRFQSTVHSRLCCRFCDASTISGDHLQLSTPLV